VKAPSAPKIQVAEADRGAWARLPAKVTPPVVPSTAPRDALLARLTELGRSASLFVDGPPGSGKTTLAMQWLSRTGRPFAFYQVDAGDDDFGSCCYYLRLASERVLSDARLLPIPTPEHDGGLEVFARRFAQTLCRLLPADAVLVFDGVHAAPKGVFASLLRVILDALGPAQRLLCISRLPAPGALARALMHGQLRSIDWRDLRLAPEDARAVAERRGFGDVPAIDALYRRADGWLAGFLLLLEGARSAAPERVPRGQQSEQVLFNYFATEIFCRESAAVRALLVSTAFLSEISAASAERLSGWPGASQALAGFAQRGYFTVARPGDGRSYEYHGLFRTFLQATALEVLSKDELDRIKLESAREMVLVGGLEDAAALFHEVCASQDLAELVKARAPELFSSGRHALLSEWLAWLPESELAADGWLLYWRGRGLLFRAPAEAEAWFSRAHARFEVVADARGVLLAWCGIVDAIAYPQLDMKRLLPWLDWLEPALGVYSAALADPNLEGAVVGSALWATTLGPARGTEGGRWALRGLELWGQMTDLPPRLQLGVGLCFWLGHVGRIGEAWDLIQMQQRLSEAGSCPIGSRLQCQLVEIQVRALRGDLKGSLATLERARESAHASGVHLFDCLLYGHGLWSALGAEDAALADELLDASVLALAERPINLDHALYQINKSWRLRLAGDARAAVQHARSARAIAVRVGATMPAAWCSLELSLALCAAGEWAEAEHEGRRALGEAKAMALVALGSCVELALARCAFARGDQAAGVAGLERALGGGGESAQLRSLRADTAELMARALAHGVQVEAAQRLIRKWKLPRPERSELSAHWPRRLRLETLGAFRVTIDDAPLAFERKAQKKPLALLKALVAFGGEAVRESRLLDALWPEAEADQAAMALTTAIHRLRKLVGDEVIVRGEGRVSLAREQAWVDVWELEREVAELELELCPELLASQARRVVRAHGRGFLEAEPDEPWVVEARERLRRSVARALEHVIRIHERAGSHAVAADCLEELLTVEPRRENTYRELMRIGAKLGDRARVVEAYRACRRMLQELGLAPSAETEALLRAAV
jgi:LuxR family maltose regulon positive regulatory protein